MHDTHQSDASSPDELLEVERLISRIVDDEGTPEDRRRFTQLAELEPTVWKRYAYALEQHHALSAAFDRMSAGMLSTELPVGDTARRVIGRRRLWRPAIGWAAVVVLSVTWFITAQRDTPDVVPVDPTAWDVYDRYRHQPHVQHEFPPLHLETIERASGDIELRYMRRLEEVIRLDRETFESLYDPDTGELSADPLELGAPAVPSAAGDQT